jgi:isopentenyl phosphate kinase
MDNSDRVIIKLGGGLITDKQNYRTIDMNAIESCSKAIAKIVEQGKKVILVHGAGSFGHKLSKEWRLTEGKLDIQPDKENNIGSQDEARKRVQEDMMELSTTILRSLAGHKLKCILHPPRNWVNGTGPNFKGDLSRFTEQKDAVHITFGDIVQTDDERVFGILSGDDLMVRLASELPAVSACVFALGDVEGVLTGPPGEKGSKLIKEWTPEKEFTGIHQSEYDVTGGIQLKVSSAAMIAKFVKNVWLVDGRMPERIISACLGNKTNGTRVKNK